MSTTLTALRRRAVVAAFGVGLLVLSGCSTLSDLTRAEPDPGAAPSPTSEASASTEVSTAPTPSAPSPEPSATETAEPSPEPSPSATPSPEPSPSPSAPAKQKKKPKPDDAAQDDATSDQEKSTEEAEPAPGYPEVGASGAEVRAVQQRLVDLGYYLPSVDGSFGPMTQQAVWAFQKAAGLYRDAVVGPKTQDALDRGVTPQPVSSSGKVVEIDLDRQLLLAVEDGRVVRTVNASSGNGDTFEAKGRTYRATTPTGTFAVYMERDYLHESTLELGSMYRPKYFTGGIAVHGSGSIPPYAASHGCIRVSNSAMDWLWDSWGMPRGTTVIVH
ncbi:L,D-transpeptidase family protein [Isoptericola aurantiacus]|uniref:L,D-transpeptidase family protein n=1 Tax=Isoptericola aurantiacus TaxID=3377839 RepID=UPI00383AE941